VFLSNAVQHLEKALLNRSLISESFSGSEELQLAAVIVGALLEFLRGESPGDLIEQCPISYLKQRDQHPKHLRHISPTTRRLLID
jgi:hypothetical protein